MSICDYKLASELHHEEYGQEISVDAIKDQVVAIQELNGNEALGIYLNEAQAFAKWLKDEKIFDKYKKIINDKIKSKGGKNMTNTSSENNSVKELSSESMTLDDLMNEETDSNNKYIKLYDGDNMYFTIDPSASVVKKELVGQYGKFITYDVELHVKKAILDGEIIKDSFVGTYGFKPMHIEIMKKHGFKGEFKLSRQGKGLQTKYILEHESVYNY
jgi:hypothetical protein